MDELTDGFLTLSLGGRGKGGKKKRKTKRPREYTEAWAAYFGDGSLEDWQRLMKDLGLHGDFSSKSKCRKALNPVWINIPDFLDCDDKPDGVVKFRSERALAQYSIENHRIYPKDAIPKGSPLRKLLAHIL